MIFDTHSHMQFDDYEDIDSEIQKMSEYWVKYSTLIWSDFKSTQLALNLAKKYDNLFVVAGLIHPNEALMLENIEEEIKKVEKQIEENRKFIVWIWEAWFDFFKIDDAKIDNEKMIQYKTFEENLKLATKFNLPLVIHTRDAWDDTFLFLEKFKVRKFVIHCFTWNYEQALKFLNYSEEAYIGFSWIITFKNAKWIQEAASKIPLERILIETDAPFLTPEPFRWKKINTSGYTKFVLDKIKDLRNEDPEIIEKQIYENSLRFYWLN